MSDATLNYRAEGQGPTLLLVHGFGISFTIWRNLLPFLTPHFTLIMLELPGIGASPMPPPGRDFLDAAADAIETVRQAAGVESWEVLGYSTGSRAAEAYVRKYPECVRRAHFLCPVHVGPLQAGALKICVRLDRTHPRFGSWILRGRSLRFLVSLLGFNLRPDPHADEWYAEISSRPMEVLKGTIRSLPGCGARPLDVPVPASFIWGDVDLIPRRPRRMGANDNLIHANHAAPVLNPGAVASAILAASKN
jgi:pimeloyl-ACP methyl ester carboxylesterase